MSKVEFKEFVKKNTHLIDYVQSGQTSWQKLYELYDLYGETNEVWNKYPATGSSSNASKNASSTGSNSTFNTNNLSNMSNSFKDLVNLVKGVDLNTVQKGLNSLDKAIEAFKGVLPDKSASTVSSAYEPRPTYKYFED